MGKLKVFNQYNHPKTEPLRCNEKYMTRQLEFYDDNGLPYLETVETINMWEKTQSHKAECDIENVLKAAALGDLTALRQQEVSYIDATNLPKSLMEAQNIVIKMKDEFLHMPDEVKKAFDYSADKYVSEMGSKEFFDKIAPYNNKIAEIEKAGSKAAYDKKVAETAKFNADVKAAEGVTE